MYWLGAVMCLIGGIWIVVNAFRNSGVLWGLGSLFVPLVAQIYALINFGQNKIPLLISVAGIVLMVVGFGDIMQQAAALQDAGAMPQ